MSLGEKRAEPVEGGILTPARVIPSPKSISAEARDFLHAMSQNVASSRGPYPALNDIEGWRANREAGDANMTEMAKVFLSGGDNYPTQTIVISGVPVHVGTPDQSISEGRVYLDIHGGALIYGGGEFCRAGAAMAAKRYGVRSYAIDYRVPPDHCFPAGLDDCIAVFTKLVEEYGAPNIVIGGTSAGGNLAAALVLRARDEGLPLPAGLVLMTPELDLTESGDSFEVNKFVDVVLIEGLPEVNALYAGASEMTHPYLSPLFGDFAKGFPPTLLQVGTRDLFLSNVARMHTALRRAKVPVEILLCEAMPHGGFAGCPEDGEMHADVREFIWRCWSR